MNKLIALILSVVFIMSMLTASAQTAEVIGRVIDKDTKEGIPFCNVYYPGTSTGTATDIDGFYRLKNDENKDSLTASAIGYTTLTRSLNTGQSEINFYLPSQSMDLGEVVVIAGENPANAIVRGIIDHKEDNTLEDHYSYELEKYSKTELDLDNISEAMKNTRALKAFDFIFDNIDTISDEKPFLPFYVTEGLSTQYYSKESNETKEIPLAQKVSGINNETVIEFIGSMYSDYKLEDNMFKILGKSFVAPFSDRAFFTYEYYIIDSAIIEGQTAHKLKFKPKRSAEKTMFGEFWVIDSTFAIQRLDMRMSQDVNINLVSRVLYFQENKLENDFWVRKKRKLIVDFNAKEDAPGMIGRQTISYQKYLMTKDGIEDFDKKKEPSMLDLNALKRGDDYWQDARHEKLSKTELQVYSMVDSIKSMPIYRTYVDIINLLITGYINVGHIELGTAFNLYSFNEIEGHRPALSIRTTTKVSKKIRFTGGGSYGFKDKRFKPTIGVQWVPSKYPRKEFEMRYKEAIDFSSSSSEDIVEGNLLASIYRRKIYQKLIHVKEFKTAYEEYWSKGFSGRLSFVWRDLDPYGNLNEDGDGFNYRFYNDPNRIDDFDSTIVSSELSFKLRYAYKERFVDGHFNRTGLGSLYPIVELQYTKGIKGLFDSKYDYHKLTFSSSYWFTVGTVGWFKFNVKAGKTFGTVPFLLAEVHDGNETFFYAPSGYNSMNKFAFASDQYVSIHLQHHFEGLFFNRIPLFKRLQLREVVDFKAVWGSMSDANQAANAYNKFDESKNYENTYNGFRTLENRPFMEFGVGVENILKVLRFNVVYRLNYLDVDQASGLNIRAGFQFYL